MALFTKTLLTTAIFLFCFHAGADEALFGYLYTTDSLPAQHWEYEQYQTLRLGKARGTYSALDLRNEVEYGVTDRLSASVYINSSYLFIDNVYEAEMVSMNLPNVNAYDVDGITMEFRYRVPSPYTDGIGLSLYMEPELSVRDKMDGMDKIERAVEFRIILQKNFLDDLLITAANIMLEPEWEIADGTSAKELWGEFTFGTSYRFKPGWFAGIEFRNHREFIDMNFGRQEHSAFFLGPNIHYGSEKWWFTFTLLPQIYGIPQDLGVGSDGSDISSSYAHLGQHEKLEARLKFGINM